MRAYVAILKDSFRESLRSRVLWLLLLAITVLLLALLPLNINEKASWRLSVQDISNRREFISLFIQQAASGEEPHITSLWESLDSDTRDKWQKRYAPTDGQRRSGPPSNVADDINQLIDNPRLIKAKLWEDIKLSTEVSERIAQLGAGESVDTVELNRRLLEETFPAFIAPSGGAQFFISYFSWEMPMPIATSSSQLKILTNITISTLISLFVGTAGVFIAILVTASMIPNTFASGSIDLLLSKPIGRSLLYLTKFLGGCSFTLLNATYLLVGFWLIAGLRLGVWTNRVLWCIPVFMFLFAIYYSVSALAGVIWRNTTICVAVSILFWFVCWTVGFARESIETFFLQPTRLQAITPAGDETLAINTSGDAVRWNPGSHSWDPTIEASRPRGGPPFAPNSAGMRNLIYEPETKQVLGVQKSRNHLIVGSSENNFRRQEGAALPIGARQIYRNEDGSLTVVCSHGIFLIDGDLAEAGKTSEPLKIGGFSLPIRKSKSFRAIGPEEWEGMGLDFSFGRCPTTSSLVIHDRGKVSVLDQGNDGKYVRRFEIELPDGKDAAVGMTEKTIVVARHDGIIQLVDVATQDKVNEFSPYPDETAESISVSANGHWCVVLWSGGNATLVDANTQQLSEIPIPAQGHISALEFDSNRAAANHSGHQLFIADERLRISTWDIETNQHKSRCTPEASTFESIYYWVINPIYKVFPKPSELGKLVQYLLLKDSIGEASFVPKEFNVMMTRSDVWNPIWSNLAFVSTLLLLGCLYVARKEF